LVASRQHENEGLVTLVELADAPADLDTIHARHDDVENDQGRTRLLITRPRRIALRDRLGVVAELLEHGAEQRAGRRVIVSNESFHRP
jgi:hypothetical protein